MYHVFSVSKCTAAGALMRGSPLPPLTPGALSQTTAALRSLQDTPRSPRLSRLLCVVKGSKCLRCLLLEARPSVLPPAECLVDGKLLELLFCNSSVTKQTVVLSACLLLCSGSACVPGLAGPLLCTVTQAADRRCLPLTSRAASRISTGPSLFFTLHPKAARAVPRQCSLDAAVSGLGRPGSWKLL